MKIIFDIAKAELKQMFYSPVAWFVLIFYTLKVGIGYVDITDGIVSHYSFGKWMNPGITDYIYSSFLSVFGIAQESLFILIPLLTMGLMSKEYSSGTIKLLYCAPVRNSQVVIGKYLSMVIFGLIIVVFLSLIMIHSSLIIKDFQIFHVMAGILGLFLLICAYSAVGLFMSSLTKYQVIAAILTIATLGGMSAIDGVGEQYPLMREITRWLSLSGRTSGLINGLICSDDIIYFVMISIAFIIFTIIKVSSDRVKGSKIINFSKYIAVIAMLSVIGYFSSRPHSLLYYDATDGKTNTLPVATQKLIGEIDGPVEVISYVNVLGTGRMFYNYDFRLYRKFVRFKPDLKFRNVFYYDSVYNAAAKIYKQYPGKTNREIMKEIVRLNRRDTLDVLNSEEVSKYVDIKNEPMYWIRVMKDKNGKEVILRTFDEWFKSPKQQEFTAALYNLKHGAPKIIFTTGHRELSPFSKGDRGYNTLFTQKTFRYALLNQGFAIDTSPITNDMCKSADHMFIADPQKEFTDEEMAILDKYIAEGGNIVILTDVGHSDATVKLLSKFGVVASKEPLYSNNENLDKEIVVSKVSPEIKSVGAPLLSDMAAKGREIASNGVLSLDYSKVKGGFSAAPLLTVGDKATAVALHREINGKRQKITIFGDSNLFNNVEVTVDRNGVVSFNLTLLHGLLSWYTDGTLPANYPGNVQPDDNFYMRKTGAIFTRLFFIWLLPLSFLVFFGVIWIRRRSK